MKQEGPATTVVTSPAVPAAIATRIRRAACTSIPLQAPFPTASRASAAS